MVKNVPFLEGYLNLQQGRRRRRKVVYKDKQKLELEYNCYP